MNSLMQYAGGKGFLLPEIMKLFNKVDARVVVEPFGGSAKFLLNIEQITLGGKRTVVYNDRDGRVANIFRQVKDNPDELADKFKWAINSREWWNDYNKHESSDPIEDAYRTLYVLALGRPERNFDTFGWRLDNPNRIDDIIPRIYQIHKIVRNWIVENGDFKEVMQRYNKLGTFYYLDPPYYSSTERKYYRYNEISYYRLKHMLDEIKGYYVMNIDDTQQARDTFGEPQIAKEYENIQKNWETQRQSRIELFYHNLGA